MKLGRLNHIGIATQILPGTGRGTMRSTRRRIALGLRKLRTKELENPWKKHDNIPL